MTMKIIRCGFWEDPLPGVDSHGNHTHVPPLFLSASCCMKLGNAEVTWRVFEGGFFILRMVERKSEGSHKIHDGLSCPELILWERK